MINTDISKYRLISHRIVRTKFENPQDIAGYFGAMQSQHFEMSQQAIGLRLSGNNQQVANSINNHEILRTHILRPTWHLVSSKDIRWMLELSAPYVKRKVFSMSRKYGLNDKVLSKCYKGIEKALQNSNYLTRSAIMEELVAKGIITNESSSTLVMMNAELDGIVCNGPMLGKQLSYALLDEKVPPAKSVTKDEALAKLARRYFISHGPATIKDFIWWSGLTAADAKIALEITKNEYDTLELNGTTFFFKYTNSIDENISKLPVFLPAFDEFIVSYTDRSATLTSEIAKQAITKNAIFKPTIIADGKVIAIWKANKNKTHIKIEIEYFGKQKQSLLEQIQKSAEKYAEYMGIETVVTDNHSLLKN